MDRGHRRRAPRVRRRRRAGRPLGRRGGRRPGFPRHWAGRSARARHARRAHRAWFWSHGDHPAAAHLAAALGYERERELLQLHTDPLDRLTLPEPRTPEDTTIRPFAPGDEDGWLQVNNAAFDWHPEQGGQARSDIAAIVDAPGFDPADVLIAERAGAVIGFHHTKLHRDHPSGAVTGEVYVIGVDPAVHAAGVGRALTVAGMHHLRGIGAEVVELYVESDNVPARRLYESLGFTHTIVHVSYAPPGTAEEN